MDIEVSRQTAVVEAVSGEVIAVKPDGSARKVSVGDIIRENEIVITANDAGLVLDNPNGIEVGSNCVGCLDESSAWNDAPIAGEVAFDLEQANASTFSDDDLAAIQDAILGGAKSDSNFRSNGCWWRTRFCKCGFVTIDYNYARNSSIDIL